MQLITDCANVSPASFADEADDSLGDCSSARLSFLSCQIVFNARCLAFAYDFLEVLPEVHTPEAI